MYKYLKKPCSWSPFLAAVSGFRARPSPDTKAVADFYAMLGARIFGISRPSRRVGTRHRFEAVVRRSRPRHLKESLRVTVKPRLLQIACVYLVMTLHFTAMAQEPGDFYGTRPVRNSLAIPASISFIEKQINRLGDRSGIALVKLFPQEELESGEHANQYLELIQSAFAYPHLISRSEDQKAEVTLFLLECLEQKWGPAVAAKASETETLLRRETAKPVARLSGLDPYGIGVVRRAMEGDRIGEDAVEGELRKLGDKVGIGLLKGYPEKVLTDEKMAKRYMALIRSAFSDPALVANPEDRTPAVTSLLLRCVSKEAWSDAVKEEASELLSFLGADAKRTGESD